MRFDLHIHSCLSPCADLEMSPRAIARRACEAGLDAIALCDHNSARNTPALREVCAAEGIACLCGMEIATVEELHALALFDTVKAALAMTEQIYAALPPRVNAPELFGEQPVVNADDQVVDLEWRLLGAPTSLAVRDVAAAVHRLGGLFIAAHVDRPMFSVSSQLGVLAGDEGFDAMELTRHAERALWRRRFPGLPVVCSSDAHQLRDIGDAWNEADLPDFTVAGLRAALAADAVHCVVK
jgi:hypothetical protein